MGIRDQPTAPRSRWQNGYAERSIGSIRRECLGEVTDHLDTLVSRLEKATATGRLSAVLRTRQFLFEVQHRGKPAASASLGLYLSCKPQMRWRRLTALVRAEVHRDVRKWNLNP